ncbi:MAG: TetR family transcriptional regulator [Betaproteobacteria bacterium]|nr:TetR family transcriptional regulator [Betaproteobacteria bacterium]
MRKTRTEALKTRERLLDAAERVFCERGVSRTSLAELATAAGVTRGAVYWHFKDKAGVFRAMCDRATSPFATMIEQAGATAAADPLATLRGLCISGLQRLATDVRTQTVFGIIFHKCERVDELAGLASGHERDRTECTARLEDIVRQAASAGQLGANADATMATRALNAFLTGVMHEWLLRPRAYDLAAAAPALVDVFLAGLRAQPPRRERRGTPRVRPKTRIG